MMATSASGLLAERPAGDDELEGRGVALLVGGVREPGPLGRVGDADGADRAVEGDARDHERRRGGVDREHVVRVHLVGAEDRADDVDLVAEALGERRAQRPVDEAGGQDRLVGRPALPAEERAGDLAGGVHPLFDVDGEREEVGALTHLAGRGRGGEHDRVADPGDDGSVGLTGKLAGRKDRVRSVPLMGPDTVMASAMTLLCDWGATLASSQSACTGAGLFGRSRYSATGSWRRAAPLVFVRAARAGEAVSDCRPMSPRTARRRGSRFLAPDPEPGDQRPVPLDVVVLHVVEQAAAAADELHQPSPGVVVPPVHLQVLGEVVDASGE